MTSNNSSYTLCGCWYVLGGNYERKYLPLVELTSHTTILSTISRTKLTQTFYNSQVKEKLEEVQYTFPIYDGVSVVSFKCTIAGKTIVGEVKERQQARTDYKAAVDRGETAGLLEQIPDASDAFTTSIGNIPANEKVVVEIEYLDELKHDAETDGSRFTIPTVIAPRYGSLSAGLQSSAESRGISISIDITVDDGSVIRGIQSPSHPIAVTMGRVSTTGDEDSFYNHLASATLTLGSAVLEKDFVIIVLAKGQETPRALLEIHPTIPNQRALMATLVPKFNLPSIHPEIVFVVDRSGSMGGKIPTLIAALKVFLKSLPVGVKFNICSFGSQHSFMFKKSKTYDQDSLQEALTHVQSFRSDMGGTEMYRAVEATFQNRLSGMPLEVLVLTDGAIWNQQELFTYINTICTDSLTRVFSLGIGSGASSSLVEGIARAGDGFAQFVDDNEKMDKRIVRMLKGALSPHISDYTLEVKYEKESGDIDDDFEIIESVEAGISNLVIDTQKSAPAAKKKVISLFDTSAKETPTNPPAGRYDHLPKVTPPVILQAPHKVPTLYSFNRTTVYLLLNPNSCQKPPKSVVLRATSEQGPLELDIPVQSVGMGQTIHQLAAKKAVHELEQGRGWLSDTMMMKKFVGTQYESRADEIIEREAVRLGVEFQVGGKFCSFVAVEDGVERGLNPELKFTDTSFSGPTKTSHLFGSSSSAQASPISLCAASPAFSPVPSSFIPAGSPGGGLFGNPISQGYTASFRRPAIPQQPPVRRQDQMPKERKRKAKGTSYSPVAAEAPADLAAPSRCMSSHTFLRASPKVSENVGDSLQVSVQKAAEQSNEETVRALIDLNNFDGSWAMDTNLSKLLGKDWDAVKDWQCAGWSKTARATAIVIAFLELRMNKEEEIWEMVVEKARSWLAGNTSDAEEGVKAVKGLLN